MSKQLDITIPLDISVEHYIKFGTMDHLSDTERIIRIVSVISEYSEDVVKTWSVKDIGRIYTDLNQRIIDIKPLFFPIIEWKGNTYGFQPISKMTAGEFIDLEKALEGGIDNLPQVLSILYRPIVKNNLDGLEWKIKNNLKYVVGKSENLFKYYEIEDYNVQSKELRQEIFKGLPIQVGLGSYSFFLYIGQMLLKDIPTYFQNLTQGMTKMQMTELQQLLDTTAGSELYTHLQKTEESFG